MTRNLQRHPDIEVKVGIPFPCSAHARAAVKALIPDNVNFPKGLSMRMHSRGSALYIEIAGKSVSAATILSTLDEVLEHVSISKKVMAE